MGREEIVNRDREEDRAAGGGGGFPSCCVRAIAEGGCGRLWRFEKRVRVCPTR